MEAAIMRVIGLDVHRTFGEIVYLEDGRCRSGGKVGLTVHELAEFGKRLCADDEVVLEATGNTAAIVHALTPHVAKVIIANPLQVRAIAHARVKTDKIDATVLAQLHASGFLPSVWMPDAETEALRRQVARRGQLVRHKTRLKNEVQSVLHAHLIPRCPFTDLFGKKCRAWLAEQPLPIDERCAVEQRLREIDRLSEDQQVIDRALAHANLHDPRVHRLLTISGVNVTVAISLIAAIGQIERFPSPQKLVSYFGLNPSVRQSGLAPARHGHITKIGRAQARGMLVEAAWAAAHTPGPLRAFFLRIRARRGMQVAAVAAARKLAIIAWHVLTKNEDYDWVRPALTQKKMRALELQSGFKSAQGSHRGRAYEYNLAAVRASECAASEQAERAYERFVGNFRPKGPRPKSMADLRGSA
jgi:transposase